MPKYKFDRSYMFVGAARPWHSPDAQCIPERLLTGDNAQRVDICLNCKRKNCPGECNKVLRIKNKPGLRPVPDGFVVNYEAGMSYKQLRHRYRCSDQTLKRWLAEIGAKKDRRQ